MQMWVIMVVCSLAWFAGGCAGEAGDGKTVDAAATEGASRDASMQDSLGPERSGEDSGRYHDDARSQVETGGPQGDAHLHAEGGGGVQDGGSQADTDVRFDGASEVEDSGGQIDAAPDMDGGLKDAGLAEASSWEAGSCVGEPYWVLRPRPIASVALLDSDTARRGASERLLVEIQLESGCELFGKLEDLGTSGDATDFVDLAASAWVPVGLDCAEGPVSIFRVYQMGGRTPGNFSVVVTDHNTPGGGMRLSYARVPCAAGPDCPCNPDTPAGSAQQGESCETDCSCADGLSCLWVSFSGVPGGDWFCQKPCVDVLDCPEDQRCATEPGLGASSYTCRNGDQCQGSDDCPAGFECTQGDPWKQCVEQPGRFPDLPVGNPCSCDAECRPGHRCIDAYDTGVLSCAIICSRHVECPPGTPINGVFCGDSICVVGP